MKVITLPSPPPMANPVDLVAYMLSPQRPEREDEPLDDEEEDDTPDDPRD